MMGTPLVTQDGRVMLKFNLRKFLSYRRVIYAIKEGILMSLMFETLKYWAGDNFNFLSIFFEKNYFIIFFILFIGFMFTYPKPLN